jgi:hypothetical protein
MMNGPQVSVVCVVVDYFFNEPVYLVVLYEVNTLLCDLVLHEFLLKKGEAQKKFIKVRKYKGGRVGNYNTKKFY